MRKVLLAAAIVVLGLSVAMNAFAFTKTAAKFDAHGRPYGLSTDCTLSSSNLCAGWIWVFNDVEGAIWGSVLNPADCPGGCLNGGAVSQIVLYSRCTTAPGQLDGVGLSAVDGVGCRTTLIYDSGAQTITHCVSGDRWTTFTIDPPKHVNGLPFAVTVTWGPGYHGAGTSSNPQLSTDNGIANLFCKMNPGVYPSFPGCSTSTSSCTGWSIPPQRTFIYVTDFNGDGILDDFCAIYGQPYPLAFPYVYPYGYLPNNLILTVGLECGNPTATAPSTWGHVKSLYE